MASLLRECGDRRGRLIGEREVSLLVISEESAYLHDIRKVVKVIKFEVQVVSTVQVFIVFNRAEVVSEDILLVLVGVREEVVLVQTKTRLVARVLTLFAELLHELSHLPRICVHRF